MIKLILLAQIVTSAAMLSGGILPKPINPDQTALYDRFAAQEQRIVQLQKVPDTVDKAHGALITCYKFRADKPGHCQQEYNTVESNILQELNKRPKQLQK